MNQMAVRRCLHFKVPIIPKECEKCRVNGCVYEAVQHLISYGNTINSECETDGSGSANNVNKVEEISVFDTGSDFFVLDCFDVLAVLFGVVLCPGIVLLLG